MIKIKGKIRNINIDFNTNNLIISIETKENNKASLIDDLKEKELSIDLKKYRKKRSLDANGYLWVLCDEIAKVLKTTKEDVYKKSVREVGVFDFVLIAEKAVDTFIKNWETKGLGWFCEKMEKCSIENCVKLMVFYGSSTYNSKEMARLIDYVIEEAKELGIDTRTPEEIENMKSLWGTF